MCGRSCTEGVHTHTNDALRLRIEESICISNLEEGDQYKFMGVLESVRQEERMSLDCAARKFLRRMSIIWSSPLSDHKRVTASNQFALPVRLPNVDTTVAGDRA